MDNGIFRSIHTSSLVKAYLKFSDQRIHASVEGFRKKLEVYQNSRFLLWLISQWISNIISTFLKTVFHFNQWLTLKSIERVPKWLSSAIIHSSTKFPLDDYFQTIWGLNRPLIFASTSRAHCRIVWGSSWRCCDGISDIYNYHPSKGHIN